MKGRIVSSSRYDGIVTRMVYGTVCAGRWHSSPACRVCRIKITDNSIMSTKGHGRGPKKRADPTKSRFAGLAANPEHEGLSVIGFEAGLVRDDEAAAVIDSGAHLQRWPTTGSRVDRYDVRLLLDYAPRRPETKAPQDAQALAEERELDEERYADLDPSREHELASFDARGNESDGESS